MKEITKVTFLRSVLAMNEIIKIKSSALPDARQPQLPLRFDFDNPPKSYPPEFWLSVPAENQIALIYEFEKHEMEYIIYELTDSVPPKSVAVCRLSDYQYTFPIVAEICRNLFIDNFVVSDGGLSSVDVNGDLQGFICFD